MKTYIINLQKDLERRKHMIEICDKHHILDYEFINAIYGKDLSQEEIDSSFDLNLAYKRYGRNLNLGEIGCTLSHYKCYRQLIETNEPCVLILEDDITILRELSILPKLFEVCNTSTPTILFLSGDYWWYRKRIKDNVCIASIYDAVGSYAYIINKAAAKLILSKNPKASCTADNWSLYRRQGVNCKAVYPYIIDANIEDFESSIHQSTFGEKRQNMPWSMRAPAYWLALVKKMLVKTGHFVSKIRK